VRILRLRQIPLIIVTAKKALTSCQDKGSGTPPSFSVNEQEWRPALAANRLIRGYDSNQITKESFVCRYQIKLNTKFIRSLKFRGFAKGIQCINRGLVKVVSVLPADFHRRRQSVCINTERDHAEVDPFDNLKSGSPDVNEIL
jgi:hypothetical protein